MKGLSEQVRNDYIRGAEENLEVRLSKEAAEKVEREAAEKPAAREAAEKAAIEAAERAKAEPRNNIGH